MKINPFKGIQNNPYQNNINKLEKGQKVNKKDKIEISNEALQLQKLGSIELERQEKVDAIKKEIQSGNYQINTRKIAEKMYSFWD